jgi:rare lipoprotein A
LPPVFVRLRSLIPVLAAVAALCVPAAGLAASGGSGLTPGTPASGQPSGVSSNAVATASGAGMTISSRVTALLRGRLAVTGQLDTGAAGQTVRIERLGRETHGRWLATTQATVAADGSFSAVWQVNHIGRFRLRAVMASGSAARAADAPPTLTVTVYRPSLATMYGPGLFGGHTACGQVLTPRTLGVANRTLPCGTPVAIMYHGRSIVVPVIDRGPYANGADWDLTSATAAALKDPGTATIDAVSLPAGS